VYVILSAISFLIRAWLCYCTIDKIPIFENYFLNTIWGEVIPVYTILMIISRAIVSTFYKRGEAPVFGVIAYFFVYLGILGITYVLLLLLTKFGVLPL